MRRVRIIRKMNVKQCILGSKGLARAAEELEPLSRKVCCGWMLVSLRRWLDKHDKMFLLCYQIGRQSIEITFRVRVVILCGARIFSTFSICD